MGDTDILKARAIELAERANRLQSRATESGTKDSLSRCADELIKLDNIDRFEAAQSALEHGTDWTEDQRSLAHEINTAWLSQSGDDPVTFEEVLTILNKWSHLYKSSEHPEIQAAGSNLSSALDQLVIPVQSSAQKSALNYLLELFESLLSHLETKKESVNDQMVQTVRLLRKMRDAVLVTRQLAFDDQELLDEEQVENNQFDRVTTARDALDEIYKTIVPVVIPTDPSDS